MIIAENTIISQNRAISKSFAKINLTLDILGRMENGYHEIETVMQTVNLFDLIIIDKVKEGIFINTNLKFLPTNEKNIAYKAAKAFFEKTGINGGVRMLIHKNIPVAAGLAGGSGNAAAVLVSLNMLYNLPLSDNELLALGATLGADIPFCMFGGTLLCKGIGEKLISMDKFPKKHILLVKPPINISTADIYNAIDNEPMPEHPTSSQFINSISNGSYDPQYMFNVMEIVTARKNPVIGGIKKKLIMNGAEAALMSGSGSTVFGIFDDYNTAKASADSFSLFYKDVYLTMTN